MNVTGAIISAVISFCVSFFLGGSLTYVVNRMRKTKKQVTALQDGVVALLRNVIIDKHEKYMSKGSCSVQAKDNVRRCYDAYHSLGGNGTITSLYEDIMELPVSTNKED